MFDFVGFQFVMKIRFYITLKTRQKQKLKLFLFKKNNIFLFKVDFS